MTPSLLLIALLLLTAAAALIDRWTRRREQVVYRRLATQFGMHFSSRDTLRLTPRVAADFPIPGAAAVRVIDLMYRTDADAHHYVFTAEYTLGVVGPKRRVRRAAACVEPRAHHPPLAVRLADDSVSLTAQYRSLLTPDAGPSRTGPDGTFWD